MPTANEAANTASANISQVLPSDQLPSLTSRNPNTTSTTEAGVNMVLPTNSASRAKPASRSGLGSAIARAA